MRPNAAKYSVFICKSHFQKTTCEIVFAAICQTKINAERRFFLDSNKKCKLQKSSLFFAIVLHLLRHMVDKFYWEANVQSAHHFALCPFEKLYFCDPRTTRVFFCDTGCCIEIVHEMDKTNVFPLLRKESSI